MGNNESKLEAATLGRTGLSVARLGAGGHFTNGPLCHEDIPRRVVELNRLLDLGVNYVDVQWTPEELATAEVMAQRRQDIVVAWPVHGLNKQSPADAEQYVRTYCAEHRARFGIQHVDLLVWVALSLTPDTGPALVLAARKAFDTLKAEGFCDHFAFSCHTSPQMALDTITKFDAFDAMMVPYSRLHPAAGRELLPAARQRGVGTIAMKPFGGCEGFLNKVWAGQVDHPAVTAFKGSPRLYEAALRWVLRDPNVNCTVPAAHSVEQVDQLHAAVLAGAQPDDDAILQALQTAMDESRVPVQLRPTPADGPGAWD